MPKDDHPEQVATIAPEMHALFIKEKTPSELAIESLEKNQSTVQQLEAEIDYVNGIVREDHNISNLGRRIGARFTAFVSKITGEKETLLAELESRYANAQSEYWLQRIQYLIELERVQGRDLSHERYEAGDQLWAWGYLEKLTNIARLNGQRRFRNVTELAKLGLRVSRVNGTNFIYTTLVSESQIAGLAKISARSLECMREFNSSKGDVTAVIIPSEFFPRPCALIDSRVIISNMEVANQGSTFCHEVAHVRAGESPVLGLKEGLAVYIQQKIFPKDPLAKVQRQRGYGEAASPRRQSQQGADALLSHTQYLENVSPVKISEQYKQEYAYRFGRLFVEGFLSYFMFSGSTAEQAFSTFTKFYQLTQKPDIYSQTKEDPNLPEHGKPLVKNGIPVAPQREIVEQCLLKMGIDPDHHIFKEILNGTVMNVTTDA
ncbi:hypothetical protein A2982_04010 [candidate division WWE3 bacterium RIFCSPLOWO2_01_FULL_39_13]|uniref:Uncharacterized protein n=1 Tax=candidate division WWE3 bacterium RIFCSPLOWO2_01_FULL_39_13 TaxID=1802624 RepID=A0A1F4V232_UNCKA|nr:MAG: hypothetical protein A2982_04010 [candidate division WWE3 bacterium RIFCSPLOWO2_01_FULL_39_13]